MAQVKNTFVKSKMNRDLDARLIPNGEYREVLASLKELMLVP
jgi:hypothetical protein